MLKLWNNKVQFLSIYLHAYLDSYKIMLLKYVLAKLQYFN